MKVIAHMAITPNGYIATPEGGAGFVSKNYIERLRAKAKAVGNIVLGRNAYDAMINAKAFPLPGCTNVVMTSAAPEAEHLKNIAFTDRSPEEVVADMQANGFEEMLLGGGGEILGSFMADGLIDELFLTVEPVLFNDGIKLFGYLDFTKELELLNIETIGEHEVELHYAVRRSLASVMAPLSIEEDEEEDGE